MFGKQEQTKKPQKTFREPPTPYGGLTSNGTPAVTGPHLLVSGVSGSGKSRRVLGPGILLWRGPVVAVSSKPDLIDLTIERRHRWAGSKNTYLLDLSGEVHDTTLTRTFLNEGHSPDEAKQFVETIQRVFIDPTALIRTDDDATDMATLLMKSGTAGTSDGSSGGGDAFWETTSAGPFAAILRAAGDRGIAWARRAAMTPAIPEEDDEDPEKPNWFNAQEILRNMGCENLAEELAAAQILSEKMRDSIAITMKSALAPWQRSSVGKATGQIPFNPDLMADPYATLYVVAPADGVAAGAAVSCIDFISRRWRANQTEEVKLPRVLLVVDELCNTMPWPKLPTVVTEARAMGINLLCAVQGTSQFAKRYGREGMDELRDVFPATLILIGAPEKEMLEKASWWSGRHQRRRESGEDRFGHASDNIDETDVLAAQQLLPRSINEGRLLRGRTIGDPLSEVGLLATLPDISEIPFRER